MNTTAARNKIFWTFVFTVPIWLSLRAVWLARKQQWRPMFPDNTIDYEYESNKTSFPYDTSKHVPGYKNIQVQLGKNESQNITVSSSSIAMKQQELERQSVPINANNEDSLENESSVTDVSSPSSTNEKELEPKKSARNRNMDQNGNGTKQSDEEMEECGCPNSEAIRKYLRLYGRKVCKLSDCTNYELDISTLEKPDTPFERYDGVVMATKILRPKDLPLLKQMVCLFNAAYNRHVGYYDIVVFTTLPWTSEEIKEFREIASPANVTIVIDSPPLEDVLTSMTKEEVEFLKKRCGCAENETISWHHYCAEEGGVTTNLGYSWQAEFRTYHIWKEPILAKYKYMIWMDSDSLPTKNWDIDPIKVMIENDLVVLYEHWPQGHANPEVIPKMIKAYNQTICSLKMADGGYFNTVVGRDCVRQEWINLIHGFHHITNLDFYRSERTMNFLKMMVEDYKFSRKFDDQMAVTIPAAMDAPNRSWEYSRNGLNISLYHNNMIGEKHVRGHGGYRGIHWKGNRKKWLAGGAMCNQYIASRG